MSKSETLIFLAGLGWLLFGLVMVAGSALSLAEGNSGHPPAWHVTSGLLLGFVPMLVGFFLCRRMLGRGRERSTAKPVAKPEDEAPSEAPVAPAPGHPAWHKDEYEAGRTRSEYGRRADRKD